MIIGLGLESLWLKQIRFYCESSNSVKLESSKMGHFIMNFKANGQIVFSHKYCTKRQQQYVVVKNDEINSFKNLKLMMNTNYRPFLKKIFLSTI